MRKQGGAFLFFSLCLLLMTLASCQKVQEFSSRVAKRVAEVEKSGEAVEQREPTLMELLADEPFTVIPPPPKPVAMKLVINKEAEVSILGYHDFTEGVSKKDMVLNIGKFREQMQMIKDSDLPVISIQDFLAWRRGKKNIPDQCVMITIDDGWKATHTLALPVLKEFGYPFTLFLYQKYVGIGGRSLTYSQVKDIMAAGGVIGSHSVSHQSMLIKKGRSEEEYLAWIDAEFNDSYDFLMKNFSEYGSVMKVYAYPYGIYSNLVAERGLAAGYDLLFTVNQKKTHWDTPAAELGRYMVYGTSDANFTQAMTFKGATMLASGRRLLVASEQGKGAAGGDEAGETALVTTRPADGEKITERLPLIELDVSKLGAVDAESIRMRVSGLGQVPYTYDVDAGVIRYQVPQRLRSKDCVVQVVLKHEGSERPEVIVWKFLVDLKADYLPQKKLQLKAKPVKGMETLDKAGETAAVGN
ncbi:MAG: polysaccharide deacetylase family protein [Verrucomicrobiales bacterium]|nr:polysaccharide deacetylase family protein [Verrucomicrobiales bacterium]